MGADKLTLAEASTIKDETTKMTRRAPMKRRYPRSAPQSASATLSISDGGDASFATYYKLSTL